MAAAASAPERPHGLKYSLFYGRPGERIVGYDNETGKVDHRHYRDREEPCAFRGLAALIARMPDRRISVPWNRITAEMAIDMAA